MLNSLLGVFAITPVLIDNPITCPISANVPFADSPIVDYNGARFTLCGPNCVSKFQTGTAKVLATIVRSGRTVGEGLFDPVSKFRADNSRNFVSSSDYLGIRYYFDSKENKKIFDENPRNYATLPSRECLVDPVTGNALGNYDRAIAYADYSGVRYYFGEVSSQSTFAGNPAQYAASMTQYIQSPRSIKMR